jgi:CHAT domain-containing protein
LYLDRATEAWRALRVQADTSTTGRVFQVHDEVLIGAGALRRPIDAGYRGATYDIISAVTEIGPDENPLIAYTLNTKRARSEVRAKSAQVRLLRQMVEQSSSDPSTDDEIRKALFKLLVPFEMEPFLTATTELQLQLTPETAGIPWELLDPDPPRASPADPDASLRPWAIRSKLIRTLGTSDFREHVIDASADASVLVIGEPQITDRRYGPLPGARREAERVAQCLLDAGLEKDSIKQLFESDDRSAPDGKTVVKTLLSRSWRIIHIAGHGAEPEEIPDAAQHGLPRGTRGPSRGVVLSDDTFLGPNEIGSLRVVPELVFLNCCHLSKGSDGQLLAPAQRSDRARFAASAASALIKAGVRCVIAAGWAVEDDPAYEFARTFYSALMRGERFIDAVAAAREAAYQPDGNTWAAYQCYGDPDWQFRTRVGDAQRPTGRAENEFADIASAPALELALHTLAVRSASATNNAGHRASLEDLETRFGERWGEKGAIAESFAAAWSEAGDRTRAIAWYRKAKGAADGAASMRALEQLGNLCVRAAWEELDRTVGEKTLSPDALTAATTKARALHQEGLELVQKVSELHDTSERASLRGSAYKRLAMIETAAGNDVAASAAIAPMLEHYARAAELAEHESDVDRFYPAMNVLAAEVVQQMASETHRPLDPDRIESMRRMLSERDERSPSFWTKSGAIELAIYEELSKGALAEARARIFGAYEQLHEQVPATRFWSSVYDHLRFVLQRYEPNAANTERDAARGLLADIKAWCGEPPSTT